MKTLAQRLAQLEQRIGLNEAAGRVIFVTGGETTDVEFDAFLAMSGIRTTPRDLVFRTTYEAHPGSTAVPRPLRLTSMTTLDGRPIAA